MHDSMECCTTCNKHMILQLNDYSQGGCQHRDCEGFACLAFADEGIVKHMIGVDADNGMCEMYYPRKGEI